MRRGRAHQEATVAFGAADPRRRSSPPPEAQLRSRESRFGGGMALPLQIQTIVQERKLNS